MDFRLSFLIERRKLVVEKIDNWKITKKEDNSVKIILKYCDKLSILEAETYLNAPIFCVKKIDEIIESINSKCENGSFFTFNPAENGKLTLYCVSYSSNAETAIDDACALLDSFKHMLEIAAVEELYG